MVTELGRLELPGGARGLKTAPYSWSLSWSDCFACFIRIVSLVLGLLHGFLFRSGIKGNDFLGTSVWGGDSCTHGGTLVR